MLLYIDSFDHYTTADIAEKWPSFGGVSNSQLLIGAFGRHSSQGVNFASSSGFLRRGLPPGTTAFVIGFSFTRDSGTNENHIVEFAQNDLIKHLSLGIDGSNHLFASRGGSTGIGNVGTKLGTGPTVLSYDFSYYVEFKGVIHDTAGSVTLRLNGVDELVLTGIDTRNAGTGLLDIVTICGVPNSAWFLDDLYLLDQLGPPPCNDFLGDVRVDARLPNGAGVTSGWTPNSAVANFTTVDDPISNDDIDYVAATVSGLTDVYNVQNVAVPSATVFGVQVVMHVKKNDAGVCVVAPVIRHGGQNYPGAPINPGTQYAYGVQTFGLNPGINPGTGGLWTEADFNAAEFGITRIA